MSANSFRLARRYTDHNEPDLLHQAVHDDIDESSSSTYTADFCKKLVEKICVDSSLPPECKKYPGMQERLQRRNSDQHNQAVAFAGMSGQSSAMTARSQGRANEAQLNRRLTSTRRNTFKKSTT